jgi:DNA (cytosine-5)-methyltransferase 1
MLNELSLFSGYGGLSLGLRLANLNTRTVAYVEWEKYPQEILKARIRDGFLDDAPIWGDISTFRGEQFRGLVDIITAGFPCQPHSVAGARKSSEDSRNKWPDTLRVIREVAPRYVLLENVSGLLSSSVDERTPAYGGVVVGQLTEIGYDCFWEVVGADDVGAPHRRKRWFCIGVAYSNGTGPGGETRDNYTIGAFSREGSEPRLDQRGRELAYPSGERYRESDEEVRTRGNSTEHGNGQLAYSECQRSIQCEPQGQSRYQKGLSEGSGGELADSRRNQYRGRETLRGTQGEAREAERTHEESSGREESPSRFWPKREPGDGSTAKELADSDSQRGCGRATHWEHAEDAGQPPETQGRYGSYPIWPPRPDDIEGWVAVLNERPDLAPALTKDALATICGVADGPTHRVDRLKGIGNGVIPAVVAAFLERVGIADTMKVGGI